MPAAAVQQPSLEPPVRRLPTGVTSRGPRASAISRSAREAAVGAMPGQRESLPTSNDTPSWTPVSRT